MPDSQEPTVSRRGVLKLGSGAALAVVIAGGAGWLDRRGSADGQASIDIADLTPSTSSTSTSTTTTSPPVVIGEIGEVDAAIITLGRRVIEVTGENDLATLLATLPVDDGDPLERAAIQVRDDFRAGNTIVVDGWVLAASEARAAAALALICGDEC